MDCAPVFVCGQVPVIIHVYAVTNACTRIVYFLHIHHACDVLSLLLYPCVADPSWLLAFGLLTWPPGPSAFGLSTWPPGPISLQASPLHCSVDIITLVCMLV